LHRRRIKPLQGLAYAEVTLGKFSRQTEAAQGRIKQYSMTDKGSVSQAGADGLKKLSDFASKEVELYQNLVFSPVFS